MDGELFSDTNDRTEIGTAALVGRLLIWLTVSRRRIEVAPVHDVVRRYLNKSGSYYGSLMYMRHHPVDRKSAQKLYASLFSVMDELRTNDTYYIHLVYVLELFPAHVQREIARSTINYIYRNIYGLR